MLESPSGAGGDTLFSSVSRCLGSQGRELADIDSQSVKAFEGLSPKFRKRLEGLYAIHSNNDGVSAERKHGDKAVLRRGVLEAAHPLVIVHPVTGKKALYVRRDVVRFGRRVG